MTSPGWPHEASEQVLVINIIIVVFFFLILPFLLLVLQLSILLLLFLHIRQSSPLPPNKEHTNYPKGLPNRCLCS